MKRDELQVKMLPGNGHDPFLISERMVSEVIMKMSLEIDGSTCRISEESDEFWNDSKLSASKQHSPIPLMQVNVHIIGKLPREGSTRLSDTFDSDFYGSHWL